MKIKNTKVSNVKKLEKTIEFESTYYIKINNLKKCIGIILTLFCLFGNTVLFATETQPSSKITPEIREEIKEWLVGGGAIIEDSWKEGGIEKKGQYVKMPKDTSNIYYDAINGDYVYSIKDAAGNQTDEIHFNTVPTYSQNADELRNMTSENYTNYTGFISMENLIETKDREVYQKVTDQTLNGSVSLVAVFDDGTIEKSVPVETEVKKEQHFYDPIINFVMKGWDKVVDTLGNIICEIMLAIADALQDLIDYVFGTEEPLTVYQVIFGKIDKLSIDYWSKSFSPDIDRIETSGDSITLEDVDEITGSAEGGELAENNTPLEESVKAATPVLKKIVNYWYGILKGIAITIYLAMLLYIGVRILLSSTGSSMQKYKEFLTSWVLGIVILAFFPYVMQLTVNINNSMVSMLDSDVVNLDSDGDGKPDDVMTSIREIAGETKSIALTFVYIIMLGQLIVLIGIYYKRVFVIAFLITIFPVVATLYIWEKTSKGASPAFTNWTKEFVVLVLTQTFHAVIYTVLIEGAFSAFRDSQNWLIFILSVTFLFKAEGIIRSIFDMKSKANTIKELATTGAATWALLGDSKKLFKGGKKEETEEEKELKEVTKVVEEAKRKVKVNQQLISHLKQSGKTETSEVARKTVEDLEKSNPLENLDVAQALMRQEALKDKTKKGVFARALDTTAGVAARAAGITLGVTSGLAAGDLSKGIANAVVLNEFAGMAHKAAKTITGFAFGKFRGQRLDIKVRSGAMDEKLREVGFDVDKQFDPDPIINSRKQELIREALGLQISGTRSGGTSKGDLKFIEAIDKGTKRETEEE